MILIALQSAAQHRRSFFATGIGVLVGTALVAAMAGVLGTGLAEDTLDVDRPFLTQFPAIMGTWILAIVVFAVVSTVAVALEGRAEEVTGLRLIGATPEQVRKMIAIETAGVAIAATIPGIALSYLFSWIIIDRVQDSGLIDRTSRYAPGIILPLLAGLLIVIASIAGGYLGAKTAAKRSPVDVPETTKRAPRGRRIRTITAAALIAVGLTSSSTSMAMDPASVYATAVTGPGVVLVAVGLALIAAEILTLSNLALRAVPARRSVSWHIARINLRTVPERIRPVVTFLILFVGVSAGTLSMQGIENTANAHTGGVDGIGTVMASINYLVVVLIAAFMAVALANNLVSAINGRREELSTMSLIGATTAQTRRTLIAETLVATIASTLVATVGAIITVIPFAIAKLGTPLAALTPAPYLATIMAGGILTIGITALAARTHSKRRPRPNTSTPERD